MTDDELRKMPSYDPLTTRGGIVFTSGHTIFNLTVTLYDHQKRPINYESLVAKASIAFNAPDEDVKKVKGKITGAAASIKEGKGVFDFSTINLSF